MTETLITVEAKYASQLIQQDKISEHEMQALAAMHRANIEADNAKLQAQAEEKKAKWDFAGKMLSALLGGTITGLITYETHRSGMKMLDRINEYEQTGSYTSSTGKSLIKKAFDWAFIIK